MNNGNNRKKIEDWMKIFSDLYNNVDKNRQPEQLWIAVMAHCSSMGESIRKTDLRNLLTSATHAFCWICSFVNKCNLIENNIFSYDGDLSGIVCLKYPLVCGHCKENPCKCHAEIMDEKTDKAARYEELYKEREKVNFKTFSISQWQQTFNKIYGSNIHILTIESIGFHFLEEAGEAAMAVRMLSQLKRIIDEKINGIDVAFLKRVSTMKGIIDIYREFGSHESNYKSNKPDDLKARIIDAKMHMIVEIADTFSWLCSVLNKLQSISKINKMDLPSLDTELMNVYSDDKEQFRCPTCQTNPCSCIFFS